MPKVDIKYEVYLGKSLAEYLVSLEKKEFPPIVASLSDDTTLESIRWFRGSGSDPKLELTMKIMVEKDERGA